MKGSICEEQTFDSVYMSYSEHLRNFIYYKSGDLKQAEDLLQESFIKLWEQCSKVSVEKAKSFLFTVANNLFLNQVKHKKVVLKFEKQGVVSINKRTPQFILEESEFESKLLQVIAALPEGQREVFLMSRVDKLMYKEIAERLDVSVKAIEKRMNKALTTIRKKINED